MELHGVEVTIGPEPAAREVPERRSWIRVRRKPGA